jgi:hypothetical protein
VREGLSYLRMSETSSNQNQHMSRDNLLVCNGFLNLLDTPMAAGIVAFPLVLLARKVAGARICPANGLDHLVIEIKRVETTSCTRLNLSCRKGRNA